VSFVLFGRYLHIVLLDVVLFFAILNVIEILYLQNILAMARINRKQNSMTRKSINLMYLRASKRKKI
jgi:hypothetical protein